MQQLQISAHNWKWLSKHHTTSSNLCFTLLVECNVSTSLSHCCPLSRTGWSVNILFRVSTFKYTKPPCFSGECYALLSKLRRASAYLRPPSQYIGILYRTIIWKIYKLKLNYTCRPARHYVRSYLSYYWMDLLQWTEMTMTLLYLHQEILFETQCTPEWCCRCQCHLQRNYESQGPERALRIRRPATYRLKYFWF
jgi:hypothetical protein